MLKFTANGNRIAFKKLSLVAFAAQARCYPGGVPGQLLYPAEPFYFIQTPKQVWMIWQRDHMVRRIYLTAKHSNNVKPSWFGESIGRYENGDSLVIDTIGFNGKAWLDPSNNFLARMESDTMHTVERLSRPDFNHLNYELTVEDPKLYTKPFTSKRVFVPMKPGSEIQEYACIPRWELKNIN